MEQRTISAKFETREAENGAPQIFGHYAVYDSPYQVCDGWVETIAPGAFDRALRSGEDIKVLWNHDTNIVLGSTANGTAQLYTDAAGLAGPCDINTKDQAAMDGFARIERGDVTGCSFAFEIARQEESWDEDGTYRTRILEAYPLYEVSPCTFPAYRATSVSARAAEQLEEARRRLAEQKAQKLETWRAEMRARLKGENHGTESPDAAPQH